MGGGKHIIVNNAKLFKFINGGGNGYNLLM